MDRPTQQSLLGGPGTEENFETFNVPDGVGAAVSILVRDNTTVAASQGPGLVVSEVTFIGDPLHWNGANYFGSPAKEINSNSQSLEIDFCAPATAIGADLWAFAGFGDTANVQVYAAEVTALIGSNDDVELNGDGTPLFFGRTNSSGVGKVILQATDRTRTPTIDNVEFGLVVPEPSTIPLVTLGVIGLPFVRRRFLPASDGFVS